MAVFVIWSVSGIRQTGNECGTYNFFIGNPRSSGICIVGNTGNRCDWHLVVGSDRMGIGRYCGIDVLQNNKKERMWR